MQAPLLIATDVDGTLLNPVERVSPRTLAVLGRALAAGVVFVLATGRPPRWVWPVVDQLGMSEIPAGISVCANGAVVYDAAADRIVSAYTLPATTLVELEAAVTAALPEAGIAVELVGTRDDGGAFMAEPVYRHAWVGSDHTILPRLELLARPAVKMLVRDTRMASETMIAALRPLVGASVDLTFSFPGGLVEIAAAGVTKASGVAEVAAAAGIAAGDVVAFGDMLNDLAMLRWAGHGVAMGNAHPVLREAADEITATNAEDGLALVLERWF